ncbi:MAG: recombination regulator RecX [Pasteurellaceae bacterium]|nr:recombination regulator RecX [Pasteurellaceae bacterium]
MSETAKLENGLALNYVITLLARRDYSEYELRCKMQEKSFNKRQIDFAITQCQARNWQNDRRFVENYLNFRAQRGFGAKRISLELLQLKGIEQDLIDDVLSDSEVDWGEIAENVLQRKFPQYRSEVDFKTKQKIWRYMLSHGFYAEEFEDLINMDDY